MGVRTGHIHPHHHTSYPVLAFLLLITGLILFAVNWNASAGTLTTSGSVSLSGVMPGPPPSMPPVIQSPSNGQHITKLPVALSGTCQNGLRVVISRNNQVAGQVYCSSSGRFDVLIDLVPGKNEVFARQYDGLDQPSPNSAIVNLFFDKPTSTIVPTPGQPPSPHLVNPTLVTQPFLISSSFSGHNIFPDTEFSIPIEATGGIGPYAVHIDWGDGGSSLLSISKPSSFTAPYTYASPGVYKIVIQATDTNGAAAYFQTSVTVNGKTVVPPATTLPDRQVIILWPIFIIIAVLVLGFWLGDRFENGRWRHRAGQPIAMT